MLLSGKNLARYDIEAKDGPIGKVEDFYFEDDTWVIRYLVVNANPWLPGHKKLITPISVEGIDPASQIVSLDLTKEEIKNAPPMDAEKPVSRQQEKEFYRYYGYGQYWPVAGSGVWGPTALWGGYANPRSLIQPLDAEEQADEIEHQKEQEEHDPHLRSLREVIGSFTGYDISATDDNMGHAENVLIKENTWQIEYFVVDTGNFLSGNSVVLSTYVIENVNWENGEISVGMTVNEIKKAPKYNPDTGANNENDLYEEFYRKYRHE